MFRGLMLTVLRWLMNRKGVATPASPGVAAKTVRNPQLNALLAVLAVVYAVSPIDLLPDVIPVVGWLDDGLVLWFGLTQAWLAMRGRPVPDADQATGNVIETTATRVA